MGLMDKAKEAALQAKASAQNIAQQGQAKVSSVQQGRTEAELYRTLGEAVYSEQRRGGDHQATAEALNALDEHFAAVAAAPAAEPAAPPPPAQPSSPQQGAAASAPPPPPSGDFTLDDL